MLAMKEPWGEAKSMMLAELRQELRSGRAEAAQANNAVVVEKLGSWTAWATRCW